MKLSKFFHQTELNDGIFAIYNSLVMDVLYVTKEKLNEIINLKVEEEEQKVLFQAGIYIDNTNQDYEALKLVKKRYKKISGKIYIMYLIMTSACNLACKYCFIENSVFNNKVELNMKKGTALNAVKKYIDYIKKEKISDASIVFYGGEPLINWETLVFCVECTEKANVKINFSVVTNATLLTEDKIKYLAQHNIEVGISIDGPKEINDKNRIYRSNDISVYDEIIEKFSMLNVNKCKYGLSITISKDFLEKQDEILEWLKELQIKSIFYNLYHYTSYDNDWEDYYKEASKFLLKSYEYLATNEIYDGRLIRKVESFFENEFKFSDCAAVGGNQITIKPNGDVCICHGYLKTDKYIIGNINKDCIYDLLSTEEMNYWKNRNTLNNDECLNCESIFICGGGCAVQAEALFGNRNCIDKPFCIHTKDALKWILQTSYDKTLKEDNIKMKEVNKNAKIK